MFFIRVKLQYAPHTCQIKFSLLSSCPTVRFCVGGAPNRGISEVNRPPCVQHASLCTARWAAKDCDIPGISKSLYRKRDWEVCGTIISAGRLWSCPVVLARKKPAHNYRKKTHADSEECLQCSVGESCVCVCVCVKWRQGGPAAHGTIWLRSP